jgi:predicted AAA+ superfamily ATPase
VLITLKKSRMIKRESYIKQLRQFIDKPLIKILTGIRRSGKSSVLLLLKEELLLRGVSEEQVIHINFASTILPN